MDRRVKLIVGIGLIWLFSLALSPAQLHKSGPGDVTDPRAREMFPGGAKQKKVGGGAASCSGCNSGSAFYQPNLADATYAGAADCLAMQFTLEAQKCITGTVISVGDSGADRSVTSYIYTDNAGSPGVAIDGCSGTVANVPDSYTRTEFLFAATVTLEAGTYWVVSKPSGAIIWGRQSSGGTGTFKYDSNCDDAGWATGSYKYDHGVLGCDPS